MITVTFDEEGKEVLTTKKTHELKTGDIIKMEGRTIVPADVVLVLTSNHGMVINVILKQQILMVKQI